jgi:hypothetical protein
MEEAKGVVPVFRELAKRLAGQISIVVNQPGVA